MPQLWLFRLLVGGGVMLNIEKIIKNPNTEIIDAYIEQNEIRDYMVENGREVAPFLYQVECQCGRFQTVKDNADSVSVKDPQCWGCPINRSRTLKKCFGILTGRDIEKHYKEGKVPPFAKGREN